MKNLRHIALAVCLAVLPVSASAQTLEPLVETAVGRVTGLPIPRFETLRFNEVNLRRGPGETYPIAWTFRLASLPVQVFREYKDWREVRDHDGVTGWIKRTQLSTRLSALVLRDEPVDMYARADLDSRLIARAAPGVLLKLRSCDALWCNVSAGGYRGWVQRDGLWGLRPSDVFSRQ